MTNESVPKIDIEQHQKTYAGFIRFSKITLIVIFNILLCLILFSYGGGAGAFFGTVLLVGSFLAAAIGLSIGDRGWIPPAIIFLLTVGVWILTVGG